MIIAKFYGGLGNQLFQYAFAKSLSDKYGLPCKADISFFNSDKSRTFVLDKLGIEIEMASDQEISSLHNQISKKAKFLSKKRYFQLHEQEQRYFYFDQSYFQLYRPKGIFADGYWQHPNYLPNDFNIENNYISNLLESRYKNILADLCSTESVAIHVRRGDYVNDKHTNEVHGACGHQYYMKAIDRLNDRLEKPRYFIFSDDIAWCKANLIGENYEFISNPEVGEWIDFGLMMNCKHQIIANSTFSWWAAWLNKYSYKKVIAPERWFNDLSYNTTNLIPGSWEVL